ACRDADDYVAAALNARDDFLHEVQIGGGHPRLGITGMDMADGSPCLISSHSLIGDLLRRDREIIRHRRSVDAARDCRRDDSFFFHSVPPCFFGFKKSGAWAAKTSTIVANAVRR